LKKYSVSSGHRRLDMETNERLPYARSFKELTVYQKARVLSREASAAYFMDDPNDQLNTEH
jgi:hypothetical protein